MDTRQFAISLDMINRHYSEPNRNRYESKYYWEELYTLISAAGFTQLEIPYEPFWMFGGRSGVPMTKYSIDVKYGDPQSYLELLKSAGINGITAISFDSNVFMRNNILGFYHGATQHFAGEAIEHAAALGAKFFIYSPTPYQGRTRYHHPHMDTQLDEFRASCIKTIQALADKTKSLGITFCVKPEFWSDLSLSDCLELATESQGLIKLAINCAHLHLMGVDELEVLSDHAENIGYIQLSDTRLSASDISTADANPTHPSKAATQVFADLGQGKLDMATIIQNIPRHCGVSLCNHQTRDPMRALLRNRHLLNQLEA